VVVGVCRIVLNIDDAYSLKEKRHVIKSIIERMKSRFNASISEVEMNDIWNRAVIGVSCVSNEAGHSDSMMSSIVNFIENDGRVDLVDYCTENIFVDPE
jgi:uncharacterized protein